MTASYEDRLLRVVRYIHDNPAGDLSLDRLADEAAMSRFHWHRVFRAMTGETCAQAVRRIRMHRAASDLVHSDRDIDTIAKTFGYPNIKSFSRAFAEAFGQTPTAFRAAGIPPKPRITKTAKDHVMFNVETLDQPARRMAALPHTGPYDQIGRAFDQLTGLFSTRDMWQHSRGLVAISCDDPDEVPAEQLRGYAGILVSDEPEIAPPMLTMTLPAGRHAILHHEGPYTTLKAAFDYLYGEWLPKSGEEPADSWPFELYHNSPIDTAPEDLRTDICVLLK